MRVVWHRLDLRLADNHALHAAADEGAVLPVYVLDDEVPPPTGSRKAAFLADCLADLRAAYRERGSDLLVREGDPAAVLPGVAAEYGAEGVVYAEHYARRRREREREVVAACEDAGLAADGRLDRVLVAPGDLAASYPDHGAFREDWLAAPKATPYPAPDAAALADVTDDRELPVVDCDVDLPPAGQDAARERLGDFLADGVGTYRETRDDLARAVAAPTSAVSRLSPYLAAGALGVRELWDAVADVYENATGDARDGVWKFRDELTWREGYYHLLYHEPTLREENHVDLAAPIAWSGDDAAFAAWRRGETGYPLVDAGMRQLEREGYVHNRPRQVAASFLTKHLLVDWRRGERHFADRLVDYDPASNAGNWQWVASTGTDTVDVRIFDPVSQMSKYDPGADFVAEYVPELRGVPADAVVDWPTLPAGERASLAPAYPDPVVDRDAAYERAQRVFETALGER